ncbi:MAG: NYN domain-containing protein [Victivallales bacterium]|nr:NYN domain-containing protein [Victivallales bacterium]
MTENRTQINEKHLKIAVLIDADNMPARCLVQLKNWVAELGEARVWRAYGNINTFQFPDSDWVKAAGKYGIDVRLLLPVLDGKKNTADIAMMLDAMELALTGQCEALCLVSRDSDFRQLALKLKTRMPVYGFVMGAVPESYLAALTEYSFFSEISVKALPPASVKATPPASVKATPPASVKATPPASVKATPQTKKKNPLEVILLSAFKSACGDNDFCLKTMLGTKLSTMRSQLPQTLQSGKKNLLKKALNELLQQTGKELFVEGESKKGTIVRLKK